MADEKQGFLEMLKRFDTGMLCTRQADGTLRARPMGLAQIEDNGDVWFVTGLGSGKVEEVLKEPGVVVTFQGKKRFLSLSGRAEVVNDEEKIASLWREEWRPWFPQGTDDPELVLLHVRGTEAEYWDETGGRSVGHALEAAKAALQGKRAGQTEGHGHLML